MPLIQADPQPALSALATVEAAAVTLMGVALQASANGDLDTGEDLDTILRAAQCQDEQHYHVLTSAGGDSLTTTFTIAPDMLADRTYLLIFLLELKAITMAGYMALARAWADLGDLDQVEICYQMGVVEGQHAALFQALVGLRPANDRAFARWLFANAEEATDALTRLGMLEGEGDATDFPGPVDRICRGIFGLTPETTSEMTAPRQS
ncbi:MAG: hypothetical protein U0Z70_13410 [Thermomicrobiales bacterium]